MDTRDSAERLVRLLRTYGAPAVAFSGGVDSSVVAQAAQLAVGAQAVAVTAVSPSLSESDRQRARDIAAKIGIRHEEVATGEMEDPQYRRNDGLRCYHCKDHLYGTLARLLPTLGATTICSGANQDDLGDFRPGLRAAAEHGVKHPLVESKITKSGVRELAAYWGLPNWEAPASPCLASRLAVGLEVTPERLSRVEAAEAKLREWGFSPVRVRHHPGDLARIEVSVAQLPHLVENRSKVADCLREIGFRFISVDLDGFRSGSLNILVPSAVKADWEESSHSAS